VARAFTERQSRCEVKKGCDGFQQILFPIAGFITRMNETLFVRRADELNQKSSSGYIVFIT